MTTTSRTPGLRVERTEHPNVERIRRGFNAFSSGDLETVRGLLTEDATWTVAGTGPLAGTYRGWEEISQLFADLVRRTDGTFTMDVLTFLADDGFSTAVYDATSTVGGRTETHRFVLVQELDEQGRARSTHLSAFDQEAADRHLMG